jgi:hypothetical protein
MHFIRPPIGGLCFIDRVRGAKMYCSRITPVTVALSITKSDAIFG